MKLTTKKQDTKRDRLADEIAGLRGDIKALRAERSATARASGLEREVEQLKLEKAGLVEANAREIRETEHSVGLLRKRLEQDRANAAEESRLAAEKAKLEVRQENLAADKQRFADEMKFQREHLQREVDRIEGILGKVLERLPNIETSLNGRVSAQAAPAAKKRAPARAAAAE